MGRTSIGPSPRFSRPSPISTLANIHCDIKPSNVYVFNPRRPAPCSNSGSRIALAPGMRFVAVARLHAPVQVHALLDPGLTRSAISSRPSTLACTRELVLGEPPTFPLIAFPESQVGGELLWRRSRSGWPTHIAASVNPPWLRRIVERCLGGGERSIAPHTGDVTRALESFLGLSATSFGRSTRDASTSLLYTPIRIVRDGQLAECFV